jgi:hypothetical protein
MPLEPPASALSRCSVLLRQGPWRASARCGFFLPLSSKWQELRTDSRRSTHYVKTPEKEIHVRFVVGALQNLPYLNHLD